MRSKIKKPQLKFLSADYDRHGNVRVYVRKPGQRKHRIYSQAFDENGAVAVAFMNEYWAALDSPSNRTRATITPLAEGTFGWLIQQYFNSAKFKNFEDATKRDKRSVLGRFCQTAGDIPYRQFRQDDVERSQAKRAATPGAADKLVKYLRALFNWAIKKKLAEFNPALGVEYINTDSQGWHTWSRDEIRQFENRWPMGTKQRLALALLMYTGVRRSDVVRLGRQFEKDGKLSFIEWKNRNRKPKKTTIPILNSLRDVLDVTPTGDLTFLVAERGAPYTVEGFGNEFRNWCRAAGLEQCSAHGLRKAAATTLAERGATASQLCAVFGWKKLDTAEQYIRLADRERMAEDGLRLLEQEQIEAEIVPLSGHRNSRGTKKAKNHG
jgi:integrase